VSLDPKIVEAVRTAAEEGGQPPALARRLVAWLEAAADESEDIHDVAATDRRLEIIYDAVALDGTATDAETDEDGDADDSDGGY
jgi:hypothetical protein